MADAMFVVTNREFQVNRATGEVTVGDDPNRKGCNELRLLAATGRPGEWRLEEVPDKLRLSSFQSPEVSGIPAGLEPIKRKRGYAGSDLVAAALLERIRQGGRNLVVLLHGYNNTLDDALDRAHRLADRYGVEVVVFSWPANGGGERFLEDIHGIASYKLDKLDARASTGALDRLLARMGALLKEVNEGVRADVERKAEEAFPSDREERRAYLARLLRDAVCPFKVTLLAHSMGNYLYKKMLLSSSERLSEDVVFDNVILKAADANHPDHAEWVRRIRVRHRVYITINQGDSALMLSDTKLGDDQRPRLGNTLHEQDAPNGTYIDMTPFVSSAHSYFDEEDLEMSKEQAEPLTTFFAKAVNGEVAEGPLPYRMASNTYVME